MDGFGALRAQLTGELHRELGALDRHDDGGGVGRLADGQGLGGLGGSSCSPASCEICLPRTFWKPAGVVAP